MVDVAVTLRRSEPDGALAGRAARGDSVAFAELARRYDDLIGYGTRMPAWGHDREDERQEALIGLFEACRAFDPARGRSGRLPLCGCARACGMRASVCARASIGC